MKCWGVILPQTSVPSMGGVVFTPSHFMLLGNCDKLHLGGLISSCTDFSHLHTHIKIDTRSGNAGICAQT